MPQAPADPAFDSVLCAEQIRLHGRGIAFSLLTTLALAAVLVVQLRDALPPAWVYGWFAALALAAGVRVAVHLGMRRGIAQRPADPRWRRHYRALLALHSVVWTTGGLMLFQLDSVSHTDQLLFAFVGVAAGALLTTAFDPPGALIYFTPMALVVLVYAAVRPLGLMPPSLPIVIFLLPVALATMWRSQKAMRENLHVRVTQEQRSEELRRLAEALDRTGAVAGVGGWEVDAPSRTLQLSPHVLRVLDLGPTARPELQQVLALFEDEARGRVESALDAALTRGERMDVEAPVRTAGGRVAIVRVVGEARRDGERIVGVGGALQDVTRLHVIDRALADKHQLLERLLRTARQGFWFVDREGRTTDVNPAMAALLGRTREELLDRPGLDWFEGEDRALLSAQLALRRDGHDGSFEMGVRRPDGQHSRCLVHGSPLYDARGEYIGSVGIWTDITRRHLAEQALRVSEVALNASAEMVSVLDEGERFHMVNDAWCRSHGRPREQVLGRDWREVQPQLVDPDWRDALRQCIRDQHPVALRASWHPPGQPVQHLHTDFYPVTDPGSRERRAVLVTRDVTQDVAQRAALVAAAEYLRGTLEATGDAIFATDTDDVDEPIRFANAQFYRLWSLPAGPHVVLTLRQIRARVFSLVSDPERELQRTLEAVQAEQPYEDVLMLTDGRFVQRRFACIPVNGRKLRVWSARDVTVERRAEVERAAAAAERRLLLENFPGFIGVIDDQMRYQHVNERLARLLQREAADIVGQPVAAMVGEQRWRKLRPVLEQTRRAGLTVADTQYLDPDRHVPLDLEVTYVAGPRHRDGTQWIYAFGVDITERKRAQAALIDALAEAERANRAKSQFLSNMSHELRTPLNAVLGFGQLLSQHPLPGPQRDQVQEILRGGRHLLGLINDLLDLGRIEAGELEVVCEPVDSQAAVEECLALLRPLALERTVVLRQRPADTAPPAVQADPQRLRQVLLNLVSNAIKYNQTGGVVVVECDALGDQVEFRVRDSGPGLTLDEQSRLFQPFERLGAARGPVDGTGIGLALSRSLVQAMDGQIGVVSEPGRGSTFWFRLPMAQGVAAAPPRPAAPAGDAAPRRRTALYIEDNPVNLMLMAAMLEDELDLVTEADPVRGLDKALALQPDLILLDIQLPGIDGYEVLRRLRADERTRRIPVVAVSANAMRSDLAAGQAAGFDAYLTKPVDLDELLATVRRVCAAPSAT